MTNSVKELEQKARQLPAQERAELVQLILESLHEGQLTEVEVAWNSEIQRRVSAYERGEIKTYAAADVLAEARQIIK